MWNLDSTPSCGEKGIRLRRDKLASLPHRTEVDWVGAGFHPRPRPLSVGARLRAPGKNPRFALTSQWQSFATDKILRPYGLRMTSEGQSPSPTNLPVILSGASLPEQSEGTAERRILS